MNQFPFLSAHTRKVTRRRFLLASGAVAGYLTLNPSQLVADTGSQSLAELQRDFAAPPDVSKPWVYWWWLDGVATTAGITADLEEMKQKGINGVLIFDAGTSGPKGPKGPKFMSEEWRANFRHAVNECARLNMEMGINLCSGWDAGGSWVEREDAIKTLVWRESTFKGPYTLWEEDVRKIPLHSVAGEVPTSNPQNVYGEIVTFAREAGKDGPWMGASVQTLHPEHYEGRTRWTIPTGEWTLLQFGYILSGAEAKLSSSGVHGWEIDPMSANALDHHFDNTAGKLLQDAGVHAGKTLKYTHIDSWEIGQPSWTPDFAAEFQKRRGYDPLPYFPALAGKTVENADVTARFQWDYRRTIADLVQQNYYGRLTELSHQHGVGTHSESGGPFLKQYIDGLECLGADDIPMAEFWSTRNFGTDIEGVSDPFFHSSEQRIPGSYFGCVRQAATAARIYGKPFCQAESFTGFDPDWSEDPYYLKADGDRAFCEGLGRIVIHHYALVPDFDVKPGNQWEHVSIHFNRNVTWWGKCGAWLTYLARCQHLLRQGSFVADILYFSGETIPNFVLIDRKPVAGFDFDCVNADALLHHASITDKRIEFGAGTSYRYLVIPGAAGSSMSTEVLRKLSDVVHAGITLIAVPPSRTPGLANFPKADSELHHIAGELWGAEPAPSGERTIGAGRVIWGRSVSDVILSDGLAADVEVRGSTGPQPIDWIHRRLPSADIYFLANDSEESLDREVSFRIDGRTPLLLDAVHGTSHQIQDASEKSGRTVLRMKFAPKQSFFVVFPAVSIRQATPMTTRATFPETETYATLNGPWQVSFDEKWGAPARVTFEQLQDWTTHADDGIRHYSGQAIYEKTFQHSGEPSGRCYLDLGSVKNIAEVFLNGKSLGIVWTAPWRVDITAHIKGGPNELKIEVVNLWPNRLIKDATLPPEKRLTSTNVRTYNPIIPPDLEIWGNPAEEERKKNGKPPALVPSGLMGPVTLVREV